MPEHPGGGYEKLLVTAERMAKRYRAVITDDDHDVILKRFERAVGPDWRARLPRTGSPLIRAVADRSQGIEAAVDSLEPWLTESQRFPARWIAAVRDALHEVEARSHI